MKERIYFTLLDIFLHILHTLQLLATNPFQVTISVNLKLEKTYLYLLS